jgi:release factor glutamine methyltransferase
MVVADYTNELVTFGAAAAWGAQRLAASSASPRLDAELLVVHVAGAGRTAIRAFPERSLSAIAQSEFVTLIARRESGVPLAYLTGTREFYSLELGVSASVLVPRPETELLVDAVLEAVDRDTAAEVLDLGTGSGAIALAIKHERPRARVAGIDSNTAALDVARANGQKLGLDVTWLESDWFSALGPRMFNVIVVNPPYVASGDPHFRGPLRHEPAAALDGGADGLDAIRTILLEGRAYLQPGGYLILEHGHDQGPAVRQLAAAHGWSDVRTLGDLAGHDRVLIARPV